MKVFVVESELYDCNIYYYYFYHTAAATTTTAITIIIAKMVIIADYLNLEKYKKSFESLVSFESSKQRC